MDKTGAPETTLESPTYEIDSAIKALSPAGFGKITSPFTQAVQQLEGTADPNLSLSSPDFDPLKALFYGTRTGLPTIVSLLLSPPYSLDPNSVLVASSCQDQDDAQDKHEDSGNDEKFKGKTALHIAILQEQPVIVGILLQAGADPITIREPSLNHTPSDLALCEGHRYIVQLMLDGILKPTTEAGKKRDLTASDVAQHSIRHAVLYAASSRNVEVVKVLLERGFPVDTRTDIRGRSALVVAAELGAVDIVRVLAEWIPKSKKAQEDDEDGWGEDEEDEKDGEEDAGNIDAVEGGTVEEDSDWHDVDEGMEEAEDDDDGRADVYILTNDNETPLSVAMMRNQRGVVRELVRLGVDLDVPWTENTRTALSLAAEQDIDGMVDLLLDLGADPDIADAQGRTALYYAISSGREGNAKQLVYRGADAGMDVKTAQQCSIERIRNMAEGAPAVLFKKAAEEGRLGEMKRLDARYGAASAGHVPIRSNFTRCAAVLSAAKYGYIEMLQWLLLPKDQPYCTPAVDYQDDAGHTPLWWAAWYGHEDAVQTLLDAGANPELEDETGMRPIMAADQMGWSNIVALLGGPGFPGHLNPRDFGKDTTSDKQEDGGIKSYKKAWRYSALEIPDMVTDWLDLEHVLFVAVTHGHVTTAALVLCMEMDVNCKNSSGQTPLMVAARRGDGPMLELLLGFGEASLELVNNLGQTALFEAASFGNDEAIGILLGDGADLTTKDQLGRTPLMAAACYGHDKAAKALIESGASLDWADYEGRTALNYAAASGSLSLVTMFLLKGAQVDKPDEDGHTPLLSSSRCGKAQVVQVMLQAGACFSHIDRNGKTALLLAAECGHESTVNVLLDSGFDMDHQCSNGQTPLMLACRGRHTMLVQMLLDRGARTDMRDRNGKTALAIAQDRRFDNIMHLFSRAISSPLNHLAPDCSPDYQYRSLSSPTSIRLLELHPAETESDILFFTLFEVDLNKSPYYETLSYEWGEPAGSVTALCNGKPMLLTPNLKQAMIRIRSSLPRPAPSANPAATNQGKVLWIDAVCINQASLPERSHQVSMMKQIYYEAKSTIFYLGPSNSLIASAVKNISLLSQQFDVLSREVPGWSPLCHDSLQVPDTVYLDKILPLWETILSDPDCVESLYDIFGRSYFTRAWIVQEILLSRDGTAVLSNSSNLHNKFPKSEELSIPWKDLLHALWALEFGARYRLIEQFPISDPKFREILRITRRFRWLKNLIASWSVSTGQRLVKYPVLMGLESLGPYKATDPRDKVYASPGFMHRLLPVEAEPKPESDTTLPSQEKGGEVKADYSLTVQQVYTNAVRYALLSDENNRSSRTKGRLDNMGKYMRPYDKQRLPGLPSWVPDWSRPIWTIKPSTAYSVGHLLDGDVEITCINPAHNRHLETNDGRVNAKLFVNGIIIDRITQVVPLTRDTPVSDIFKLVTLMLHFEHNGTSILSFYPHMTTVSCEDKPITYLAALWDAITSENKELHTPERTRDILGFLLSNIIDDEKIPESVRNELLQQKTKIMECTNPTDKIVDLGKEDLFLEEYDWMERQVWRGDLVITSRGGFGITNRLGVADTGMVAGLIGGADEVYLLRQHNEEDQDQGGTSRWYEFVDVVDMRHMRRYFGSLEEVVDGASKRMEGLEIR